MLSSTAEASRGNANKQQKRPNSGLPRFLETPQTPRITKNFLKKVTFFIFLLILICQTKNTFNCYFYIDARNDKKYDLVFDSMTTL